MTQQAADISDAVERDPTVVLPLEFDENSILFHLDNLKVFQPRICDGSNLPGECLQYISGTYNKPYCEIYESAIGHSDPGVRATADPSSCPSSNIGGMLALAQNVFSGTASPDPNSQPRADSLWVTVLLASGPANASTPAPPMLTIIRTVIARKTPGCSSSCRIRNRNGAATLIPVMKEAPLLRWFPTKTRSVMN